MGVITGALYFLAPGRSLDLDGSVTVGTFVPHGALLDVFRTNFAFNNHPYFSFIEHLVWDLEIPDGSLRARRQILGAEPRLKKAAKADVTDVHPSGSPSLFEIAS